MVSFKFPIEFPVARLRLHSNIQKLPRELRPLFVYPANEHIHVSYGWGTDTFYARFVLDTHSFLGFYYKEIDGERVKLAGYDLGFSLVECWRELRGMKEPISFETWLSYHNNVFPSILYPFHTHKMDADTVTRLKYLILSGNIAEAEKIFTHAKSIAVRSRATQYMFSIVCNLNEEGYACQRN